MKRCIRSAQHRWTRLLSKSAVNHSGKLLLIYMCTDTHVLDAVTTSILFIVIDNSEYIARLSGRSVVWEIRSLERSNNRRRRSDAGDHSSSREIMYMCVQFALSQLEVRRSGSQELPGLTQNKLFWKDYKDNIWYLPATAWKIWGSKLTCKKHYHHTDSHTQNECYREIEELVRTEKSHTIFNAKIGSPAIQK